MAMQLLVEGYPPVPADLIAWALRRAVELAAAGQLNGYRERWFIVPRHDEREPVLVRIRESVIVQVKPRGLYVEHDRRRWWHEGRRVVQRREVLAACYLEPGGAAWEQAATLLEALPDRGAVIDTRGD
jgi:hypothetical protein